jgi:hypothetical protein
MKKAGSKRGFVRQNFFGTGLAAMKSKTGLFEGVVMKKVIGAMFALALGAVVVSGEASASPIGLDGPYAFALTPTDPAVFDPLHIGANVLGLSVALFENVDFIGRLSMNDVVFNPLQPGLAGASLTGTGLGGKNGTWSFTSGADLYEIVAVEINATAAIFGMGELYLTDPIANNGNWDTSDIYSWFGSHPNLNYLDFYGVKVSSGAIPEPMTLALVGGGLAGFGFLRRKKRA